MQALWSCSIIASRLWGRWFYTFFVILRDGKLGGGWYLIQVRGVTVKCFYCRTGNHTKRLRTVADEQHGGTRKVRPQGVAARRQIELLCVMAFQELDWHAIDDVDFDVEEVDSPEVVHESGTPISNDTDMGPVWTCD